MKAQLWNKLKLFIPAVIYFIFYITWFFKIEHSVTRYTIIHTTVDNFIPFIECFVIPYFLWFPYVAGTVIYLCMTNRKDYIKTCVFLFTGMTIFLMISSLFPNGHQLRPNVFPRDNIFTHMIASLYATDTPTNIVPSIHVYNSIGVHIAISKCEHLKNKKWITIPSLILCVSIILSTVLIKQHSVFDVITAFIMASVMYPLVYAIDYRNLRQTIRERKQRKTRESTQ